ncbi:glucose-6-phosphate isomerase, partial [gut metagenome]
MSRNSFHKKRIQNANIKLGGGLVYNWAAEPVTDEIIDKLQAFSDEMELVEKYQALLSGEMMNPGEKRLVLHQLTRGNVLGCKIEHNGEDKEAFYKGELDKIKEFSEQVRSGKIVGSTGKKFKYVCQIG